MLHVLKQLHALDEFISRDPVRGRRLVRHIFKDVRITVMPPGGRPPPLPRFARSESMDASLFSAPQRLMAALG
jgi:hypothetical protein